MLRHQRWYHRCLRASMSWRMRARNMKNNCTSSRDESIDFPIGLTPNFRTRSLEVCIIIRLVLELVSEETTKMCIGIFDSIRLHCGLYIPNEWNFAKIERLLLWRFLIHHFRADRKRP